VGRSFRFDFLPLSAFVTCVRGVPSGEAESCPITFFGATFPAYTRRIYVLTFRMVSGFESFGPLAQVRPPLFGVCSSGRRFAYSFLQIPPRGEHPCCSAGSSHHRGLRGDFHPQVYEVTTTATSFALARHAPCLAHRHESLCLQAQASYSAAPTSSVSATISP
jgi:hypothetical protein